MRHEDQFDSARRATYAVVRGAQPKRVDHRVLARGRDALAKVGASSHAKGGRLRGARAIRSVRRPARAPAASTKVGSPRSFRGHPGLLEGVSSQVPGRDEHGWLSARRGASAGRRETLGCSPRPWAAQLETQQGHRPAAGRKIGARGPVADLEDEIPDRRQRFDPADHEPAVPRGAAVCK